MEAVKRAKPLQKKIVRNILPIRQYRYFLIRRLEELTVGKYLPPGCSFGGIFIHRSLQDHQNHMLAYPLRPHRNKSARGILEIRNRREAIVHEKKKTNSISRYSFRQRRLRSELALRSRRSRKWTARTEPATATNATNYSGATGGARSPTNRTNAGAARYYS
jgi:hypothetical protein